MENLLTKESEHIYRRSAKSNNYIFDIKTKQLSELSSNGKQMFPTFSADSKKVAFVRDNNLFYKNLETNEEIQVTTDGANNKLKWLMIGFMKRNFRKLIFLNGVLMENI
ncbi:MAG: DPP IV N-terminal domain-containing protein [Sphingobacteriaceae bacterium]|nr:DPP IV N-terminal domain-containing protein [Sphingobacteriaceae bacterium]